jgi:heme/copper-type cytochrome/quinol oxidase subunit 2
MGDLGKMFAKSPFRIIMIISLIGLFFASICGNNIFSIAYAHLGHLPHYNGGGIGLSKYYVNQAIEPEYARPGNPAQIIFSIQDYQGNDVHNIRTMIEVYSASTGERLMVYPWTQQDIGDFAVGYTFSKAGNYQIVVSIANEKANTRQTNNGVDPPRSALGSTFNCNCERAVFTISVSKNFGDIFTLAIFAGILAMITVLGLVLWFIHKTRRRRMDTDSNRNQIIKYLIMLLALSAGVIHLAVFSEHGSLRIEYSIFLLAAGASQVAYSISYVLLTLTNESDLDTRQSAFSYHHKTMLVNLFGLVGNLILLGLYLYAVILSPPLSPNNKPEDIDVSGILDKSIEVVLVIGIIYLMRWERKRLQSQIINIK